MRAQKDDNDLMSGRWTLKKRKKYAAASVVLALGLLAPSFGPTAVGAEERDVVKLRILVAFR
ncbi:2'3'-cyclic-nucleotide 2'-phosphodiesterase [Geobacillus stearothermophilus]|uniref:2',3'-cyclic-nucleotide 2'-phosphodiesterase n=2 Tax=Anoxybacillaceae TaxID=3120669 RepID=A0A150N4Y3_GEOSE|nr:2'3'-cyclic-nucleotide 2'-phosphodiesterase [Geobacillus stearothermophilus]KYD31765.1 2',3'-cyclic-nucleotide 2'-phosphodiesterase [Geobacillus stearothermophilus]OAO82154.1 2'3'-cyclic-nucleotide 2'-phosphodiesterase [Geobacillus stearothermophilus]